MLDKLPSDILFNVLVLLEPKYVIRCKCVSNAWNACIRDQSFIKLHQQRSIKTNSTCRAIFLRPIQRPRSRPSKTVCDTKTGMLFPLYDNNDNDAANLGMAVEIPQWYNFITGRVCIGSWENLALWNPSLQSLKEIPDPQLKLSISEIVHFGFGYDSINDDYKIVVILQKPILRKQRFCTLGVDFRRRVESSQVNVYSIKSNSWKSIQNMPCEDFLVHADGVYLNNALSWMMDWGVYIIALDLVTEKYRKFQIPVDEEHSNWKTRSKRKIISLGILGGYLCICQGYHRHHRDNRYDRHHVWIMKEYGVADSWTHLFSIDMSVLPFDGFHDHPMRPLVLSNNGKMVLLKNRRKEFLWFNIEKNSVKPFEIPTGFKEEITIWQGVGSLFLLLDGFGIMADDVFTEVDEKETEYQASLATII